MSMYQRNKNNIPRNELFVKCPYCEGKRNVMKRIGKGSAKKLVECDTCKGAGVVTYSKDYLMFKVMELNRKINLMWEVLKHKRPIPESFMWNIKKDCHDCNGKGEVLNKKFILDTYAENVKCTSCDGRGYTSKALKKVFEEVFKTFTQLKKERDFFNYLLVNKSWAQPEVKYLQKLKPKRYIVVCTRCVHYLSESKDPPCTTCCNSLCLTDICNFEPITPEAAKWYRQEGHKWNFKGKY